jgi:hypothetical protein
LDCDDDHYVLLDEAIITTRVRPRVCIAMPLRNAQQHLARTIESILAQTFSDLELVICDNASTDASEQICREFVRRDKRVIYTRLPQTIRMADNRQRACRLGAGSQFFKWAMPGELLPSTFIQRCVEALDRDSTAVLAFAHARRFEQQQQIHQQHHARLASDSHCPTQRFAAIALANHALGDQIELLGLFRRAALELIPPPADHPAAERVFLARLALVGRFVQVPEAILLACDPSGSNLGLANCSPRNRHMTAITPPLMQHAAQIGFPEWRLMLEYLRSIQYGWLSLRQRAACAAVVLHRQLIDGNWVRLTRDVALAGQKLLSRLIRRPTPDLVATTATPPAIAPSVSTTTLPLPAAAPSVPKAA